MSIIKRNGKLESDKRIYSDYANPSFYCPNCGLKNNMFEIDSLYGEKTKDGCYVFKCNECGTELEIEGIDAPK